MISAIDTNVLIDVLTSDTEFHDTSMHMLNYASERGRLIIGEIVYAELAVHFVSARQLDSFLHETRVDVVPTTREALVVGARAWQAYVRTTNRKIQCPACGSSWSTTCPDCGRTTRPRQHIVSDFLIGAHALVHANRLITRDRGFYRHYFDSLRIVP